MLDFGSGVTFFPFRVANEGFTVTAVDCDPIVQREFGKAMAATPCERGRIAFLLVSSDRIPVEDAIFDAVYSISVLEHSSDPISLIDEFETVLIHHGLLLVTADLSLLPGAGIDPDSYGELLPRLEQSFDWYVSPDWVHPRKVLTPLNSPWPPAWYARARRSPLAKFVRRLKDCAKLLLGKPPSFVPGLACIGMALTKE